AAQRVTTGLWSGLVAATVFALAESWLGLTMAFYTDWPVSFCIAVLSALVYFACLALSMRMGPAHPVPARSSVVSARALHLHAMFGHVFDRARMPWARRIILYLVLQREVLRFAVHRDEIRLLVEDGLDDVVGILVGHFRVRNEDVPHNRVLVVCRLSGICAGLDGAAGIQVAV